ncbi:MAG: TonB-dependent receptor plug domain-containing protein [Terrimonas sp.]|nr:TonB-dependent receptor plug domain-containing protein [Terrimonas sp.]
MKKTILFAIMAHLSIYINAQALTGKVFDAANKNPLSGATVKLGTEVVSTDKDGHFKIACSISSELTVTYIGYAPFSKFIRNCNEDLNIGLTATGKDLEAVEITATSSQNKQILYQPSSITKLQPTELKRASGLFLDDAINANVPGVTMNRRTVAAGQQFNIRGYGNGVGFRGASNNFDGLGYKVYLNGIPVTDAEGITLMDDIDFASVGNVEVTKGPAGTLYGLAIAGVVNLETMQPEKGKVSLGQDILVGNYGLQRYTTHFMMGGANASLLVNYGKQKSDGFMPHNASSKDFINLAGDFQPNDRQSLTAFFGYANSYDQRAGELTISQYQNFDYSGNPAYIKNNAHSEIIGFRAGLGHTYKFNDHFSNATTVYVSAVSNNSSSAGGWTDKNPLNFGLRSTFNNRIQMQNGFTLGGITGIETQRQQAQIIGYAMIPDSADLSGYNRIGNTRSNQFTITATTSLFTEWTLSMPHEMALTAGIGISNMMIELNDRLFTGNYNAPKQYAKKYSGMVSPHIAFNKVFNKQVSAYAAYSKGYKAPVSSQFFIPQTGQLNTGLDPEVGNQFEIGTKGAILKDRLSYQLALFNSFFSDKMTAVAVTSGNTTLYTYIANSGKQNNKGIELLLKYAAFTSETGLFRSIRSFANLTYSDFKYENFKYRNDDYSGKAVAGVAKFMSTIGVDINAAAGIYANLTYSYKDPMPISSDGMNYTHSYNLLNAKLGISRQLSNHFAIDASFGVTNITGVQYYYMVFVNQLPDAYLPATKDPNYFAGINLKYNF